MTNLPGILVLGLAKAQLIQIFFFRLNLLITVLGLLHGLVFLPVILSYLGECQAPPARLQATGKMPGTHTTPLTWDRHCPKLWAHSSSWFGSYSFSLSM